MKHYQLQADEVILYRGQVNLLPDGKPAKPAPFRKAETDIILTNLYLVVDNTVKGLFGKSVDTLIYDVNTVKKYNDIPQVIQKGVYVDVYLIGTELFFRFPNKKEATLFTNEALKLLTGFSKLVRGVKKAQKAVKETEEALNIDITGAVKTATSVTVDVVSQAKAKQGVGKTIGMFAQSIFKKKKEKEVPALTGENMEKLSNLKKMLDENIISEEEYKNIKSQILNG